MKKFVIVAVAILIVALGVGWKLYSGVYSPNSAFEGQQVLILENDLSLSELMTRLEAENVLEDLGSFETTAGLKDFELAKAGRYRLEGGINNNTLINMLRSGWQAPIKLTFNNARKPEDLAGKLAKNIQPDSAVILNALHNPDLHKKYGFDSERFRTMFIPNTYEVYWNTSAENLVDRMAKEYKTFWSDERKSKAKALGLSQSEITILASIVNAETQKIDEASRVAGVYLNRLRINMALQADPTLVFALNDFSIRRVLDKHKQIESPYNTYKYTGLPPGPINYPSGAYIDAVLNAETHKYLYFCAKEDFSGYHSFAKTLSQHEANARRYRRALNQSGIYH